MRDHDVFFACVPCVRVSRVLVGARDSQQSTLSRNKSQPLRSLTRRGIHPVRRFGHDADAARHDEAERVYRSVVGGWGGRFEEIIL